MRAVIWQDFPHIIKQLLDLLDLREIGLEDPRITSSRFGGLTCLFRFSFRLVAVIADR